MTNIGIKSSFLKKYLGNNKSKNQIIKLGLFFQALVVQYPYRWVEAIMN